MRGNIRLRTVFTQFMRAEGKSMQNPPLRSLYLGVMLGLLIAFSPTWMNRAPAHTYDAPWVYPTTH